jgi:hypothetical protein
VMPTVLEMMNWLMTSTLSGVTVGRPVEEGDPAVGARDGRRVGRGVCTSVGAGVLTEEGAVVGFGVADAVGFGVAFVVGGSVETGVDEGDSVVDRVGAGVSGF